MNSYHQVNNKISIIKSDSRFKGASQSDNKLNISFDNDYRELIEGDRSTTLNLIETFDRERRESSTYRFYGKLQPFIDNAYSGSCDPSISNLIYSLYNNTPQNYTSSGLTFVGFPQFKEFDFIRTDVDESVNDETNWNLFVSLPTTCNHQQPMTYTPPVNSTTLEFTAFDGIPFYVNNVTTEGRTLLRFTCPVEHGLNLGEYVLLNIRDYSFLNTNTYPIYSLGDGTDKSEKFIFNLLIPYSNLVNPVPNNSLGTFRRQLILGDDSSISTYYVLENEIVTNVKDYNLNRAAFARGVFDEISVFEDELDNPIGQDRVAVKVDYPVYVYTITKDIDISRYTDNLGRPISKAYISIFLRNNLGYFNYPPNYGWSWNFPYNFVDNNVDNNHVRGFTNDPQPVSGVITPNNPNINSGKPLQIGDKLRGDFMEYNQTELKERVVSNIKHKFNFNGNVFSGARGYVYKPHNPIQLRVYSEYIEEGDPNQVVNVPGYSTYFETEKTWKWRDLYDVGFVENGNGVDYPFINKSHYPKRDINFFVHRTNRSEISVTLPSGTTIDTLLVDGCE